MKYFLDTYALIEIAEGNPKYKKYLESDAVTLRDNLAELFYFLLRKYNERTANFFHEKFMRIALEFPPSLIPKAMIFRYSHKTSKFSYFDCYGYMHAIVNDRIFLTGDRAFRGMSNVELVR